MCESASRAVDPPTPGDAAGWFVDAMAGGVIVEHPSRFAEEQRRADVGLEPVASTSGRVPVCACMPMSSLNCHGDNDVEQIRQQGLF